VTKLEPRDHNSVGYTFSVRGTPYAAEWFGHGVEGNSDELRVGQMIRIYYDATDPDYSCYCVPSELSSRRQLWRTLLVSALISLALTPLLQSVVRQMIWRDPGQSEQTA
jgi:hypothetical protein